MAFEAAPAAVPLSKPDRKCNKGAWLRLDEALAEQSGNETLCHFGCWVLQKKYLWSDQFHHNEELLFVAEAVLEERKKIIFLIAWDVREQQRVKLGFAPEGLAPTVDAHAME